MKNNYSLITVATITLTSLLLIATSSATTSSSVTISFNGSVQDSDVGPTCINKAVYWYSGGYLSSSDVNFIASHFTMLNTDWFIPASTIQSAKALNPNLKIIGYKSLIGSRDDDPDRYPDWPTINSHEDWFLHSSSGSRLKNPTFNWYCMDPASAGWRAYLVSVINQRIASGGYDGVFLDDVYGGPGEENPITDYVPGIQSADLATWTSDVLSFLQYIKANITPGKLVIINTPAWHNVNFVNAVDGRMFEGFAHAEWESSSSHERTGSFTLTMINLALADMANGKIVWMASGSTPSDNTVLKYCYTAYLLMADSNSYWGYNSRYNSDGQKGYYSIMDTSIGSATGAYYQIGTTGVYARNFTNATVLCNLSGASRTVTVGSTTITLPAYSGEIL